MRADTRENQQSKIVPFLSDIVLSTKKIRIRNVRAPYNPAIIEADAGYVMAFRYDRLAGASSLNRKHRKTAHMGIICLDEALNPVGRFQELVPQTESGQAPHAFQSEDPRLFKIDGNLHLVFNDTEDGTRFGPRRMYICQVRTQGEQFRPGQKKMLACPEIPSRTEKNWVPFTHQQALFFIHTATPHLVLRADVHTGVCRKEAVSEKTVGWAFGEIRGGTPARRWGDDYVTFFHSSAFQRSNILGRDRKYYYMGAYVFRGTPPFDMLKITPRPITHKSFYGWRNTRKVIFPAGLALKDRNLLVSYGQNDASIHLALLDSRRLLESMTLIG